MTERSGTVQYMHAMYMCATVTHSTTSTHAQKSEPATRAGSQKTNGILSCALWVSILLARAGLRLAAPCALAYITPFATVCIIRSV